MAGVWAVAKARFNRKTVIGSSSATSTFLVVIMIPFGSARHLQRPLTWLISKPGSHTWHRRKFKGHSPWAIKGRPGFVAAIRFPCRKWWGDAQSGGQGG